MTIVYTLLKNTSKYCFPSKLKLFYYLKMLGLLRVNFVFSSYRMEIDMKIWVDADACPKVIKDIIFRAAQRTATAADGAR